MRKSMRILVIVMLIGICLAYSSSEAYAAGQLIEWEEFTLVSFFDGKNTTIPPKVLLPGRQF